MNKGPIFLALFAGFTSVVVPIEANAQERSVMVDPPPFRQPIVPQAVLRGDREFDGHGPDITIQVDLHPSADGSRLEADVYLHAIETQENFSETELRLTNLRIMDMRPGERLVRIDGPTRSELRFRSGAGATPGAAAGTIGPGFRTEDGGCICTAVARTPGPVESVVYLGDTSGDDISDDNNPHGDLSIRQINFRRLTLIVE